jgi:histidinol-phosphate aminotransferase
MKHIRSPSYVLEKDIRKINSKKHIIKLCSNESFYEPNPAITSLLQNIIKTINIYPSADSLLLKNAITHKYKNIKPDQILVGNGSTEIYYLIGSAFFEKGSNIIVSEYSYPLYKLIGSLFSIDIITVPMKNWNYQLDAILRVVNNKTKAIFLANPNNPTGTWLPIKILLEFIKKINQKILLIIDEAYYEFMSNKKSYETMLAYISLHKNLIVTRTFSKAYGFAGLRIGYGVSSKEIIEKLARFKLTYNVNSIAQKAAISALDDYSFTEKFICEVGKNRKYLVSLLKNANILCHSTETNFILVKYKYSSNQLYKKLLSKGIIVQPMNFYGIDDYIRVSIGKKDECKTFFETLKGI